MAHLTGRFLNRRVFPFLVPLMIVALAFGALPFLFGWWLFFVQPVFVLVCFLTLRRLAMEAFRRIRIDPGIYEYSPWNSPRDWHIKMGYLWLVELLTPRGRRLSLYRKCGAPISLTAVSAGQITEPDMTEIGDNVIIGIDALVSAHEIFVDRSKLFIKFSPISIGSNSVIGARAIVGPGVSIPPGTMIKATSRVWQKLPRDIVGEENPT